MVANSPRDLRIFGSRLELSSSLSFRCPQAISTHNDGNPMDLFLPHRCFSYFPYMDLFRVEILANGTILALLGFIPFLEIDSNSAPVVKCLEPGHRVPPCGQPRHVLATMPHLSFYFALIHYFYYPTHIKMPLKSRVLLSSWSDNRARSAVSINLAAL